MHRRPFLLFVHHLHRPAVRESVRRSSLVLQNRHFAFEVGSPELPAFSLSHGILERTARKARELPLQALANLPVFRRLRGFHEKLKLAYLVVQKLKRVYSLIPDIGRHFRLR